MSMGIRPVGIDVIDVIVCPDTEAHNRRSPALRGRTGHFRDNRQSEFSGGHSSGMSKLRRSDVELFVEPVERVLVT